MAKTKANAIDEPAKELVEEAVEEVTEAPRPSTAIVYQGKAYESPEAFREAKAAGFPVENT